MTPKRSGGMSLADARRYMVEFNDALGVQCRDCHNPKSFPSDEKPLKLAARDMMKMQREINARWFADEAEARVTCSPKAARASPLRK